MKNITLTKNFSRIWNKLTRHNQGSIMIEFAVVMPIIMLLLFGGFEIFRAMMVERKSNQTVSTMTNLVSQRQTLTSEGITDVFNAIEAVMNPFELGEDGQVIISYVTGGAANATVNVQCSATGNADLGSKVGSEGGTADLGIVPGNFSLADGETVVISEIYFRYEPIFTRIGSLYGGRSYDARDVYHLAIQKPRNGQITFPDGCPT